MVTEAFGRPQGLAFDATGALFVVDALAGAAGLYRADPRRRRRCPRSCSRPPSLVGVAFDPPAVSSLASNDTIWKLDVESEALVPSAGSARTGARSDSCRVMSLFRVKPPDALVAETAEDGRSLRRALGAGDLIMLAIGAVIGAGIFGSIGSAAAGQIGPNGEVIRLGAGPALVLSFVLLGACCALAGLCYAEMAAMIPQAGSAYAYSYATLGEFVAWIIGWDLILEYAVGNVAVAISWGDYFKSLRGQLGRRCRPG